jgi:hypothetical protein
MSQKKRILFPLSLLLSVILIASCAPKQANSAAPGNSSSPQQTTNQQPTLADSSVLSSSGSEEACNLLTKEQVSKVLGVPVLTAESSGLGGLCTYKTTNLGIDFLIAGHTGGIKSMNTTQTRLGDSALVVSGLGDLAFYNTNAANALLLLKGDAEYTFGISELNYQPLDTAFVQNTEKALAEQLLANLK